MKEIGVKKQKVKDLEKKVEELEHEL